MKRASRSRRGAADRKQRLIKLIGPLFNMSGPVGDGAKRYVDAAEFGPETSGQFWASPPGVLIGDMEVQKHDHYHDEPVGGAVPGWFSSGLTSQLLYSSRVR